MISLPHFCIINDVPAIKQLLKTVFNESSQFIIDLFDLLYHDNVIIIKDGDKLVSMAFLLPATILIANRNTPLYYVYACATHPDYLKRGFMGLILEKAWQEACRKGYFGIFLQPANDALYHFYQKEYFQPLFYCKKQAIEVVPDPLQSRLELFSISYLDYDDYRKRLLHSDYSIHWDRLHLRLAQLHPTLAHADFFRFYDKKTEEVEGIAFIQNDDQQVEVSEIISNNSLCIDMYQAIAQYYNVNRFTVITQGEEMPTGLIRVIPNIELPANSCGYFSFPIA